jgi:hypothetical protein
VIAVFVRRCAWHRKYHGYTKILGVAEWSGWGVSFTDGMCASCAERVRAEFRKPTLVPAREVRRFRSLRPDFALTAAVVMLAVTVTFGLIAAPPTYEGGAPRSNPAVVASTDQPAVPESAAVPEPATAPEPAAPPAPPASLVREPRAPRPRIAATEPGPSDGIPAYGSRSVSMGRVRAVRGTAMGRGGGGRMAPYRPAMAVTALTPLATERAPAHQLETPAVLLVLLDASIQAP